MVEAFEDPIEEAKYYRDQMNHNYLTPVEIAQRVGKDRAQIAVTIQLLRLPSELQNYVRQGLLQKEQGAVLSQLKDDEECLAWGRRCLRERLSAVTLAKLIKSRFN